MEDLIKETFLFLSLIQEGDLQSNVLIFVLLILFQVFFSIFFLPCSQFSVLSGMLFGPLIGSCINVLSSSVSFSTTFFISRKFGYKLKSNFKYFNKFTEKLSANEVVNFSSSWQSLLLFYANPLVPGSSMGYFYGLSDSAFIPLIIRSIVLVIFPGFVYASAGSEFLDQLVEGKFLYALIFLIIILVLFRYAYPFLLKKFSTNHG
jgi:uncharacterized membrane protein YdjX (TVP38/TMEM64 family)